MTKTPTLSAAEVFYIKARIILGQSGTDNLCQQDCHLLLNKQLFSVGEIVFSLGSQAFSTVGPIVKHYEKCSAVESWMHVQKPRSTKTLVFC